MSSLPATLSRTWRSHRDKLTVVLLVALAVKLIAGVFAAIDLGLADEALYMERGLSLGTGPLPPADGSPLYSIWYRLLAVVVPAPASLYYFNWALLQGGLAVSLYVLARRSGAAIGAAVLVTIALVSSQIPFVWPYVTYFSTLLLACTAIAATYAKDRLVAAAISSAGLFAAAFVRPELWWPSVLVGTACLAWGTWRATSTRNLRPVAIAIAPAVAAVCGRAVFGNPVEGDRGIYAFAQHYALNKVEAGNLPFDPWAEYEALFRPDFPRAQRVSEALLENPSAALWHVRRNLELIPRHLADVGGIHAYVPVVPRAIMTYALVGLLVLGAIGLVRGRRSLPHGLVRWIPLGLPIGIGAVASSVVVYPREHYLVPPIFFGLAALAAGTSQALPRLPAAARAVAPVALAVGLVILPTLAPGVFPSLLDAPRLPTPRINKHVVETLRSLGLQRKVVLAEWGWSRGFYAGFPFEHVSFAEKNGSLWSFVEGRHVDVLVLDRYARESPRLRDDPEVAAFLSDESSRRDFVLVPVPGEDAFVAVRKGALRAMALGHGQLFGRPDAAEEAVER